MKDQLIRYVDLLFAGASNAGDIKQEILQNTLDRYDDLVAQGKTPEAAYSLAISGIGDVSELLSSSSSTEMAESSASKLQTQEHSYTPAWKKALRAIAVCMYIISIIPLIVLAELDMEILGLCGMLAIVGVATALIIITAGGSKEEKEDPTKPLTAQQELRKAVKSTINTIGLVVYFAISFLTQAWHITWLIFPIMGAVNGLVNACIDLKEAGKYES